MPEALWGLGVSAGTVTGPAYRLPAPPRLPPPPRARSDPGAELERAYAAIEAVRQDLERRSQALADPTAAEILRAQAALAGDRTLRAGVTAAVRAGDDAPHAVAAVLAQHRLALLAAGGVLATRAADLDDLRDRMVAHCLGRSMPELPDPTVPYVLLAAELSPADAALLDPARVLAVVTSAGSFLSHTAILARARGLPTVVACGGALDLPDGTLVTVDGTTGRVIIGGPRALSTAAGPVASAGAGLPGRTADGHPVALLANIGSAAELSGVDVEGVGLFRTELLFQHHVEPPTMTEQITAYAEVFAALPGRPVIVRTLDVGPDKPLPFLRDGFRGLRVVRGHDDILRTQLAAIAAAARGSTARVAVMAPMIATVTEATQFAARCREAGLATVGVMIEVPAAAVRAAEILRVVDFLSVGTNDLSQYAFAADRGRAELADLLDPWQPALLSLVAMTADAGTRAGRPVGVCGEAAADPALAVVLAGMGVNSLSMTPAAIPAVRAALAAHTLDECRAIARAALAADDPAGARSAHTGTPETQHL